MINWIIQNIVICMQTFTHTLTKKKCCNFFTPVFYVYSKASMFMLHFSNRRKINYVLNTCLLWITWMPVIIITMNSLYLLINITYTYCYWESKKWNNPINTFYWKSLTFKPFRRAGSSLPFRRLYITPLHEKLCLKIL